MRSVTWLMALLLLAGCASDEQRALAQIADWKAQALRCGLADGSTLAEAADCFPDQGGYSFLDGGGARRCFGDHCARLTATLREVIWRPHPDMPSAQEIDPERTRIKRLEYEVLATSRRSIWG
jgi:hypothetical protein